MRWYNTAQYNRLAVWGGRVYEKQLEWRAQRGASHNRDHSPKCCAKAALWPYRLSRDDAQVVALLCQAGHSCLVQYSCRAGGKCKGCKCGRGISSASWFHRASLTNVRPTGDVQDRAAELTCHLPPFTLLFLLTPELPKQFPLRWFTQWP